MDCLPSQVGGLSNCWLVPHLNTLDPVSLYPLKHWTRASSPYKYCLVVSVTNPFLIIGNVGHRAPAKQKLCLAHNAFPTQIICMTKWYLLHSFKLSASVNRLLMFYSCLSCLSYFMPIDF